MTPGQAEAARGRLEAFINALLEASISALTDAERADSCLGGPGRDRGPAVNPRCHQLVPFPRGRP